MKKFLLIVTILLLAYSSITTYKLINQSPSIVETHDTIPGDTMFKEVTILKPVPYQVTVIDKDTITIPADTAELAKRYKDVYSRLYASKSHRDTLKNVSECEVAYDIHISQNTLDSLKIGVLNNRATIINNTYVDNGAKISVGCIAGFKSLTPMGIYRATDKISIGAGVDIINKSANFAVFYKIK